MSYPNVWLHVLKQCSDLIRRSQQDSQSDNYSALATGAHDVLFTHKILKKYGITTISISDMKKHMSAGGEDFYKSSNLLAGQVLKSFGYEEYSDLDIYDRADIVCNLSEPLPERLVQKFDLVMDITSTYVTNIIQSYSSTSRMTKIGGKKIVVTTIGDHTNRFDLTPSPNFLIDFHIGNGFELERAFLINPRGKVLPYKRYDNKFSPAYVILPIHDVIITVLKTVRTMIKNRRMRHSRGIVRYPCTSEDINVGAHTKQENNQPQAVKAIERVSFRFFLKSKLKKILGEVLFTRLISFNRRIRYLRNAFFHDNLSHEWYAYFLFEKVAEVEELSMHVTSHYKNLDQTN